MKLTASTGAEFDSHEALAMCRDMLGSGWLREGPMGSEGVGFALEAALVRLHELEQQLAEARPVEPQHVQPLRAPRRWGRR